MSGYDDEIFDGLDAYVDTDEDSLWRGLYLYATPVDFDPWTDDMFCFLGQDVWWRPKGQDPVPLDDLDLGHLHNLQRFLDRNAGAITTAITNQLWSLSMRLQGETAIMECDRILDSYYEADPRTSVLYRGVAARVVASRRRDADVLAEGGF